MTALRGTPWVESRHAHPRTVADMRAMTIAWLSGEIIDLPTYLGPPSDETAVMVEPLITLNRKRFLTTGSQPGVPDRQRTYVSGYTSPDRAQRLSDAINSTDLVALLFPVWQMDLQSDDIPPGVPVTVHRGPDWEVWPDYVLSDGQPYTFIGRPHGGEVLRWLELGIAEDPLTMVYVEVFDPTWGRDPAYLLDRMLVAVA